ncbi:MAG: hypothetical protein SPL30_08390 [Succinivibrio sp.]|jgi:hypothetical protein|nr:hypothetical protein [Succinivibrio sp.]
MSKNKKKNALKQRNFVQAHVQQFNAPAVFRDRRLEMRRGMEKHRGAWKQEVSWEENPEAFFMAA